MWASSVKTASWLLAGRLLPRLVIMHSSAETPPRQNTQMCKLTACHNSLVLESMGLCPSSF